MIRGSVGLEVDGLQISDIYFTLSHFSKVRDGMRKEASLVLLVRRWRCVRPFGSPLIVKASTIPRDFAYRRSRVDDGSTRTHRSARGADT